MVDPGNLVIYPSKSGSGQADALKAGKLTEDVSVSGSELAFWALRAPDLFDDEDDDVTRELVFIDYSAGNEVTRTVSAYGTSGSLEEISSAKFYLGNNGSISFEVIDEGYADFASPYEVAGVRIKVTPTKPSTITGYEIYVGSCGPDGIKGNEDDIYPWGEGEAE